MSEAALHDRRGLGRVALACKQRRQEAREQQHRCAQLGVRLRLYCAAVSLDALLRIGASVREAVIPRAAHALRTRCARGAHAVLVDAHLEAREGGRVRDVRQRGEATGSVRRSCTYTPE